MAVDVFELVAKYRADTRQFIDKSHDASRAADKVGDSAEKSSRRVDKVGKVSKAVALGGITVLGAAMISSVGKAIEAEKSQARMESQLKALNIPLKAHAGHISDAIDKTSKLAAIDDEELQDAFTKLLPATKNVDEALDQMSLAADVARARNISLESATALVTRANAGSAGALRRLGINMIAVKDHQIALAGEIKRYVKEHGPLTAAEQERFAKMKINAKELDRQAQSHKNLAIMQKTFAGAAEAYGNSSAGAQERFRVALENLQESFGQHLLPVLQVVINALTGFLGLIDGHEKLVGILVTGIIALAAGIWVVTTAIRAWAAVQAIINVLMSANPIGVIIVGLAALVVAILLVVRHWDIVKAKLQNVWDWISDNWPLILAILTGPFGLAVWAIIHFMDDIKNAITGAWEAIKGAATTLGNKIKDGVIQGATGVVGWVTGKISDIISGIAGFFQSVYNTARGIGSRIKSGVQDGISGIVNWVGEKISDVGSKIAEYFETVYNKGKTLGGKVIQGIKDGMTGVGNAFAGVGSSIGSAMKEGIRKAINAIISGFNAMHMPRIEVDTHIPGVGKIGIGPIEFPNLPYLAEGGIVTSPTLAVIGERGREAVIPLEGPNRPGLGNTYVLNFPNYVGDKGDLADMLREELLKVGRRNLDLGLT